MWLLQENLLVRAEVARTLKTEVNLAANRSPLWIRHQTKMEMNVQFVLYNFLTTIQKWNEYNNYWDTSGQYSSDFAAQSAKLHILEHTNVFVRDCNFTCKKMWRTRWLGVKNWTDMQSDALTLDVGFEMREWFRNYSSNKFDSSDRSIPMQPLQTFH